MWSLWQRTPPPTKGTGSLALLLSLEGNLLWEAHRSKDELQSPGEVKVWLQAADLAVIPTTKPVKVSSETKKLHDARKRAL